MATAVDIVAPDAPVFFTTTAARVAVLEPAAIAPCPACPPAPPTPLAPVVTLNTLPQTSPDGTDFGQDVDATFGLNPFLPLVGGLANLAQAALHRLSTPRGSLPYDGNYGYDVRELLNETMTPVRQAQAQSDIQGELRKDERVQSAAVAFQFSNNALQLFINLTTASGPFNLVLQVTKLSVQLLAQQ